MMASRVVREQETLESIRDASELYHVYYRGVRSDLDELGHPDVRRTAGIITLLRVVDRSNAEQMEQISSAFGVPTDAFWEAVHSLHSIEVVDLYENEMVKVSDQVLATYLFYLAVFDSGEIELAKILEHLFPAYRHRIIDALNGVIRVFGSESTFERVREGVNRVWKVWEESGERERLLDLMHTFWFVRPTETLLYASEQIQALEVEPRGELNFDYQNAGGTEGRSLVGLLGAFRSGTLEEMRIALDLLLDYAARRTEDLPHVLKTLTETFGFRAFSPREEFQRESIVVAVLQERVRASRDPLFADILSVITAEFLKSEFHRMESGGGHVFKMINFSLTESDALRRVREALLQGIAWLARNGYKESMLRVLERYVSDSRWIADPEIAAGDAKSLLVLLNEMSPNGVRECMLVLDYLDQLDHLGINYGVDLRARFSCPSSDLANLLLVDRRELTEMSWDEGSERHRERVQAYFRGSSDEAWAAALRNAESLLEALKDDHSRYQVRNGISIALLGLATEDAHQFLRILGTYLQEGEYLALPEWQIVWVLREQMGPEASLEFLRGRDFSAQRGWLSTLFVSLAESEVTPELVTELLTHLEQTTAWETPRDLEFLEAYRGVDPEILLKAVRIISEKTDRDPAVAHSLASLFNRFGQMLSRLQERFASQQELLERAYLLAATQDVHMDHDGSAFALISEMDPTFPLRYLQERMKPIHSSSGWNGFDNSGNQKRFAQLWKRKDYEAVIRPLIDHAYAIEKEHYLFHNALPVLLSLPENTGETERREPHEDENFAARQDELLQRLVRERVEDEEFIIWVFEGGATLPAERKRELIKAYLVTNPSVDAFKRIAFEPRSWSSWGSLVPVYQRQLEFLESLLPFFDRVALLQHRAYVEERIDAYRKQIRNEKRSDFFDD